jgi:dihydrofolate reductase
MIFSIIVAMSENRVIGINNSLPWHISSDLKRFKELTSGNIVVMGRKTFESIGKPLPNRKNYVLTRNKNLTIDGVTLISSLDDIIESNDAKVFIIGGGEIYSQTINKCNELIVTRIKKEITGDAYFPEIDLNKWRVEESSEILCENSIDYCYVTYTRK